MLRNRPGSIPESNNWVHMLRNPDGLVPFPSLYSSFYAAFGCIYAGMAEISAPFEPGLTAGYWVHILRIMHHRNRKSLSAEIIDNIQCADRLPTGKRIMHEIKAPGDVRPNRTQ